MRAASSIVGILLLALSASSALAQPTPAEIEASKKTAAEAANGALQAYGAGKYEEAITGFRKAEAAFHAPKFLLYVARSQAKLGKLLAAKATYEGVMHEKLTSYAPPEFFTAQTDAKKELAELAPRIPTLEVRATGGIATVTIDGQPAVGGQRTSLDPGDHVVSGTGPGMPEVTRKITLKEGEARVETLEPPKVAPPASATASGAGPASGGPPIAPGPTATVAPSVTATAPGPASSEGPGFFAKIPTATYVAYGVGAAGLIVGGVFGGLTLSKKGDYDALRSHEGADPRDVNQAALEGQTLAIVSDVGFLVGLAGAATGTVFWLLSDGGSKEKKTGRTTFVGARAGGMTIGGTF